MKTYTSSDLTHKKGEVMREANNGGVVIQRKTTNGDVVEEFVMFPRHVAKEMFDVATQAQELTKELTGGN